MSNLETETTKIETTIRFAIAIDKPEESGMSERYQAAQHARAEGVSTFELLRTHILLKIANGSSQLVCQWLRE